MRVLTRFATVLGLLAILWVGGIWLFQTRIMYGFAPNTQQPADFDLPTVRSANVIAEDGANIRVWVSDPAPGKPVLLSFYGNYAAIGPSASRLSPLLEQGYGMAMMEYRGSGETQGQPSEAAFAGDARSVYDQLDRLFDEPVDKPVLHGFSLGAGVAAQLAAQRSFSAQIYEAAGPSICQYFAKRYFGLPMCRLMWSDRYEIDALLAMDTTPKLFVWGTQDTVIPPEWSQALFDAAADPKTAVALAGGQHADLAKHGLFPAMTDFLNALEAR